VTAAAADVVVVLHLLFILYVVLGGLFALKWRRAWVLHLPAAAWGAAIELLGWWCPLTSIENRLREAAGRSGYEAGFVDHYIVPLVYPPGLTRGVQLALGVAVVVLNGVVYTLLIARHRRRGL
jgi:hypothetical protein